MKTFFFLLSIFISKTTPTSPSTQVLILNPVGFPLALLFNTPMAGAGTFGRGRGSFTMLNRVSFSGCGVMLCRATPRLWNASIPLLR